MTTFKTEDLEQGFGSDDDYLPSHPQNSARSFKSSSRNSKLEFSESDNEGAGNEGNEADDDEDYEGGLSPSQKPLDRNLLSQEQEEFPSVDCELFKGLATLQVNETGYPSFKLVDRLRCRAHGLNLFAVAHSVYLVNVLNGIRSKCLDIQQPDAKYTRKLENTIHSNPAKIAVIGCGRLGCLIVKSLVTFSLVEPSDIKIGTPHPEKYPLMSSKGFLISTDIEGIAKEADVIFICVPPHAHIEVLKSLDKVIRQHAIVMTFSPPYTVKKLKFFAPNLRNLIRPEYDLVDDENNDPNWKYNVPFPEIFESKHHVRATCPLNLDESSSSSSPVRCGSKLLEILIYAAFNHCCHLGLNWRQTMDCLNIVLFGSPCDVEDHASEEFIKIHDVVLNENAMPAISNSLGYNTGELASPTTAVVEGVMSPSLLKNLISENAEQSLATIESQIDLMLKR